MTWVKICGTTSLEDARVATDAGADALGFIFAPSPRRISPKDARSIISQLPAEIEKIGVFVNQSPRIIMETAAKVGLTGIQFHGDEDGDYLRDFVSARHTPALDLFKVIALGRGVPVDANDVARDCPKDLRALVLDSGSPSQRGGTGDVFDWPAARLMIKKMSHTFKVVIAGGLRPRNVGEVIEMFHPWGVDVVSGVERAPGKKDPCKVTEFVTAVRQKAVTTSGKDL